MQRSWDHEKKLSWKDGIVTKSSCNKTTGDPTLSKQADWEKLLQKSEHSLLVPSTQHRCNQLRILCLNLKIYLKILCLKLKSPSRSSQTLIPRTSMTCKTSQRNKTRFMGDLTIRKRETLTATPVAASSGGRSGGSLICNRRQALQRVEPRHCCCWRVYSLSVSPSLCICVSLSLNSWWSGRGNGIQNEEERWVSSPTLESVLLTYPWRNPRIFAEKVNKNLCCCCCGGLYLSLLLLQSVCCCGDNFLLCYLIDPILLLTQTNPRERPCGMCEGLEFSCWAWAESTRAWAPWRGF